MGWTSGTLRAGETGRDEIIRAYQGDPTSCGACGWSAQHHPRVTGSEYDAIYSTSDHSADPAHDFRPFEPSYRVLDIAIVAMSEAYLAVETIATGDVWAGVALVRWDRDGSFSRKEMTETMGPGAIRCPRRIFDRLTPTTDADALAWRADVRARLDRPKVKPGDRITFERPITFTSGAVFSTFEYVKGSTFRAIDADGYVYGTRYSISSWRESAHTVAA